MIHLIRLPQTFDMDPRADPGVARRPTAYSGAMGSWQGRLMLSRSSFYAYSPGQWRSHENSAIDVPDEFGVIASLSAGPSLWSFTSQVGGTE